MKNYLHSLLKKQEKREAELNFVQNEGLFCLYAISKPTQTPSKQTTNKIHIHLSSNPQPDDIVGL